MSTLFWQIVLFSIFPLCGFIVWKLLQRDIRKHHAEPIPPDGVRRK